MTELTINIADNSMVPHLKKILEALEGVSIVNIAKKRSKSGIDEALEDVEAGRVTRYESVEDFFKDLGI